MSMHMTGITKMQIILNTMSLTPGIKIINNNKIIALTLNSLSILDSFFIRHLSCNYYKI